MSRIILVEKLTREAFAPFGDVIDFDGPISYPINGGMTQRFHDLARVEVQGPNAHALISLARGQKYDLPLTLKMVERHPFGSQAFIPLSPEPFIVITALEGDDGPGRPRAFLTAPGQGINYHRNTWHGVLTPIHGVQDFLVVDRGGDGSNLEEFFYDEPWEVRLEEEAPS